MAVLQRQTVLHHRVGRVHSARLVLPYLVVLIMSTGNHGHEWEWAQHVHARETEGQKRTHLASARCSYEGGRAQTRMKNRSSGPC